MQHELKFVRNIRRYSYFNVDLGDVVLGNTNLAEPAGVVGAWVWTTADGSTGLRHTRRSCRFTIRSHVSSTNPVPSGWKLKVGSAAAKYVSTVWFIFDLSRDANFVGVSGESPACVSEGLMEVSLRLTSCKICFRSWRTTTVNGGFTNRSLETAGLNESWCESVAMRLTLLADALTWDGILVRLCEIFSGGSGTRSGFVVKFLIVLWIQMNMITVKIHLPH